MVKDSLMSDVVKNSASICSLHICIM